MATQWQKLLGGSGRTSIDMPVCEGCGEICKSFAKVVLIEINGEPKRFCGRKCKKLPPTPEATK